MNLKSSVLSIFLAMSSSVLMAHEGEVHEDEGDHLIPHEVAGINIDGGMTWFFQGVDGTNNDSADLTYTLDLNFTAPVGENGQAVVAFEAGNGAGVDGRLGSLSTANYDAFITELSTGANNFNSPSLSQIYYEGRYMDEALTIQFGKLDVHSMTDDNAFANDETDQFLSGIFTRTAGSNFAELDQYYAPGLAATYSTEMIDLTGVIANGNNSGFNSVIDRPYSAAQINIKPELGRLEGNYRLFYILDGRRYTDVTSGASTDNTAWGISFDQAASDNVGVFIRYSAQDDAVQENVVESAWSLGASIQGALWGRDDDVLGLGYGSINVNGNTAITTLAGLANPDDETHTEIYYKFGISEHFTVTPDIQVITNNSGNALADTVTVYGLRGQINL